MITLYVLKNIEGDYLCVNKKGEQNVFYLCPDAKLAVKYLGWQAAKVEARRALEQFGQLDLYRWIISEEKDEE